MQVFVILIAIALILLIIIELGLRFGFGFGNPPLYIPDADIGYLLAPHQNLKRFGNRIIINQYSMRNQSINPKRAKNTFRIMLLGDSLVNGGWWTDQSQTLSALIEQELNSLNLPLKENPPNPPSQGGLRVELSTKGGLRVEVLNIAANSWSPRNQVAYLKHFGTFESQIVILLLNTDDLFGTKPTALPVGRDRNYPQFKPPLAIIELITHFLKKPKPIPEIEAINKESGDRVGKILAAIDEIYQITQQNQAQLIIAISPLLREIGAGSRDYEIKAKNRLKMFTETKNITYLDLLPIVDADPSPEMLYRDHIHLSPQGNQLVSQNLTQLLKQE